MDGLLPALLATGLAELGDKTQILAVLLAMRFRATATVLAAIACAAAINSLAGAAGGVLIHDLVSFRATTLMLALALLFAGVGALMPQRAPDVSTYGPIGIFLTCFLGFLILEFGDKSQFITMTLAARTDSFWMTAIGATFGIMLANAPAILLAGDWPKVMPLRALRIAVGCIFLLFAALAALHALRLV